MRLWKTITADMSSCLGGSAGTKYPAHRKVPRQVPVKQIDVTDLPGGDIFQIEAADGLKSFYYPESEELGGRKELVADVAYVARLRNPFQYRRTLTICNGIHSRGVLGAVLVSLTRLFASTTRGTWRPSFRKVSSQYCCEQRLRATRPCPLIFEIQQYVCTSGNRRAVDR